MNIFNFSDKRKFAWFLMFVLLPLGLAFNVDLQMPLMDSFHEGEYLGNVLTMGNYYAGLADFPLLIHGAMDYLPSLLAENMIGGDHLVVWTRFLNVVAVAIGWLLFLDCCRVLLRGHPARYLWSLLFFLLFVWMAVATGDDPVHKQQAFLGTRDVFLIFSLWCGCRGLHRSELAATYLWLAGSGAFAALSLYWSYDRGIIAFAWLVGCISTLLYQRKAGQASCIGIAYTAVLFAISAASWLGSLHENLINILYWINNTGDVWFMHFRGKLTAIPAALTMVVFAISVIVHTIKSGYRTPRQASLPLMTGLILVQLIYLTKLYSLPGYPTTYYVIWPSFLLLILTPPASPLLNAIAQALDGLVERAFQRPAALVRADRTVIVGALVLLSVLSANAVVSGMLAVAKLARPLPDSKLIDANHYRIAEIKGHTFECVFQWSNEGIFATLSKKPYCTKYMYAVYIARSQEAAALAELKHRPPGLIVYDSPFWSMAIYGRSMQQRLPAIDRFINENYVFHKTASGYVFATPKTHEGIK